MEKLTQIQITKKTRADLQKLRLTERESYEEVIRRLIAERKDRYN